MMNEIQLFNNPEFGEIRTLETETGRILFCGKDVATALGYAKPQNAILTHCRYALKQGVPHPQSPDKTIEIAFIPESDVYRLAFSSKLPNAERFTEWVTEKVLPSIMRTGTYSIQNQNEKYIDIQLINARTANANVYLTLMQHIDTKSEAYKSILMAYAANTAAGQLVLPLPKLEFSSLHSASEVGEILGISKQKVGRIANANGLKSEQYGEWYHDIASNGKEVDIFRYNDKALEKLREILNS